MEEQRDKPRLLDLMNTGYTEFTTLIAPLNAAQLTIPGVDHQWSIKDILVHLSFWQHHLLTYLQSAIEGKEPKKMTHETIDALRKQYPGAEAALAESEQKPAPTDDASEMNDYVYLRNKSRQLDDVQTDFHTSYAQVVAMVRSMDETLLFDPGKISWGEGTPLYAWVAGNTFGHYEEHIGAIKNWLASQA